MVAGELLIEDATGVVACHLREEFPEDLIRTFFESGADLRPGMDGFCTSVSWVVSVSATPGTLME